MSEMGMIVRDVMGELSPEVGQMLEAFRSELTSSSREIVQNLDDLSLPEKGEVDG